MTTRRAEKGGTRRWSQNPAELFGNPWFPSMRAGEESPLFPSAGPLAPPYNAAIFEGGALYYLLLGELALNVLKVAATVPLKGATQK